MSRLDNSTSLQVMCKFNLCIFGNGFFSNIHHTALIKCYILAEPFRVHAIKTIPWLCSNMNISTAVPYSGNPVKRDWNVIVPALVLWMVFSGWPLTALEVTVEGKDTLHRQDRTCYSRLADLPHDQIWLVSTRRLCSSQFDVSDLSVSRLESDGTWMSSNVDELYATDNPHIPTCVWIHGNQVPSSLARQRGLNVYQRIVASATDEQPLRFVIWSWPSNRKHGILADVRAKAARTNMDGYYLAWFLSNMHPEAPVTMVGFSFGPRIMTGALHLLGGGSLNGRALPEDALVARRPIRNVMMASALHSNWLRPRAIHGRALSQVDHMLLLNNSCDPILQWYRFISRCSNPEALGYRGLSCPNCTEEELSRITQRNVCCSVGRRHEYGPYIYSNTLMAATRRYVFWEPLD